MKRTILSISTYVILLVSVVVVAAAQSPPHAWKVKVSQALRELVADEDTDHDHRITIDDVHIIGTGRGDKRHVFTSVDGRRFEVAGTYYLANLLQELKLAEESGFDSVQLRPGRIFEDPADRISRSIRELYWDGLTRTIDESGLGKVLHDEKAPKVGGFQYLYVPAQDKTAYDYYSRIAQRHSEWKMKVIRLPHSITGRFVRNLDGYHGLLSLSVEQDSNGKLKALPFAVPGGRFNEMYGWDSYFIVLGLLKDGRVGLAKSMVDNFVYQIKHYGAILNANRTYYLTRSQPPFLTSMFLEVNAFLPKDDSTRRWLRQCLLAAIKEYRNVWMNAYRLTETGLSRFYDFGTGPPPEVEEGHFDEVFARFAPDYGKEPRAFEESYRSGELRAPELDEYFIHDRAMRESGHDTSYRLEGRCADLVTVDLNSLLYKFEMDIARTIEDSFDGLLKVDGGSEETSTEWYRRAADRRKLVKAFLWDQERGMFFDYNFRKKQRTGYVSATTFYPMWSGLASPEEAKRLAMDALRILEAVGGIVGSSEESRGPITPGRPLRQWDYPHGWAPHQVLVWRGLMNYGYAEIAHRLAYRWLYTITLNATNYSGTVPEKFDLEKRTHQVFAEYGNVGTKFSYITREGFGWTNASFQIGLAMLPPNLRESLNRLIPPEWIFGE